MKRRWRTALTRLWPVDRRGIMASVVDKRFLHDGMTHETLHLKAADEDIRALRKLALDGPLSVAPGSRDLLTASLAVAQVKNGDQGSFRLAKRGRQALNGITGFKRF